MYPVPSPYQIRQRTIGKGAVATRESIRITVNYDFLEAGTDSFACTDEGNIVSGPEGSSWLCGEEDILTTEKKTFLQTSIVDPAVQWLETTYSIERIQGNLWLNSTSSCTSNSHRDLEVPPNILEQGVPDTDLYLFVTARPVVDAILAYAGECAIDQYYRPIAGHLNFNPSRIVTDSSDIDFLDVLLDKQIKTAIHEIHHVLGFSFSKFSEFVNPITKVVLDRSTVVEERQKGDSSDSYFIITPTVIEKAKAHFNCETIDGVELEDRGGSGTANSHWEKRLFMNEFMTGTLSINPAISSLTLALMEDSGHYSANYDAIENLWWGKNQGCDFVQNSCDEIPAVSTEFCWDQEPTVSCSFERIAIGICNVDNVNPSLDQYQYFDDSTLGGSDDLADYCPYVQAYSNGDCRFTQESDNPGQFGESYGSNSRCYSSSLVNDPAGLSTIDTTGRCYDTICTSPDNLKVKIVGIWYNCPWGEEITPLFNFTGSLTCPGESEHFCSHQTNETNTSWPCITEVSPETIAYGDDITITTQYTLNVPVTVHIGVEECVNVEVVDEYTVTCSMPSTPSVGVNDLTSFNTELATGGDSPCYVLVTDSLGFQDMHDITLIQPSIIDWLLVVWDWAKNNVIYASIAGSGLVFVIIGLVVCCCCWCKRRRKNRKVHPAGIVRVKKGKTGKKVRKVQVTAKD